jgi:hypothetical protein
MMRVAAAEGHGADTALAALAREARLAGMRILAPKAPFLAEDEVRLIGWIAYRQREWELSAAIAPLGLDDAADACARALKAQGLRLPFLAVQRLGFVPGAEMGEAAGPHATLAPRRDGSLKAAALTLARQHPVLHARELRQAGISRQYLSRLCKAGLLIRTGYGFYRAA